MHKSCANIKKIKIHHYRNVVAVANNIWKAETKSEGLTKPILKSVSGNYIYIL